MKLDELKKLVAKFKAEAIAENSKEAEPEVLDFGVLDTFVDWVTEGQ